MPAKKKTSVTKRSLAVCSKARSATTANSRLNFTALVDSIRQVHEQSAAIVGRTVNTSLTVRNWVIGGYIHHYELYGRDRAKYGEALIEKLAERLMREGLERMDARELRRYRLFFMTYPGIRESVTPEFVPLLPVHEIPRNTDTAKIRKSAISKSGETFLLNPILRSVTGKSRPAEGPKVRLVTEQYALNTIRESLTPELGAPIEKLLTSLSFTHLAELIAIDDPLKRAFYRNRVHPR